MWTAEGGRECVSSFLLLLLLLPPPLLPLSHDFCLYYAQPPDLVLSHSAQLFVPMAMCMTATAARHAAA